jgi:hypothetical protein
VNEEESRKEIEVERARCVGVCLYVFVCAREGERDRAIEGNIVSVRNNVE